MIDTIRFKVHLMPDQYPIITKGFLRCPYMNKLGELKQRGNRVPVEAGLLVYQTQQGGTAERAGLKGVSADGSIGDIILSAEGQKLTDLDDLYRLLDKKQIGDTVNFEIYRGGRIITVPVKLLGNAPATRPTTRRIQ